MNEKGLLIIILGKFFKRKKYIVTKGKYFYKQLHTRIPKGFYSIKNAFTYRECVHD